MIFLTIKLLMAVVITEAVTEIITKSELFRPFRALIYRLGSKSKVFEWLHSLLDCGYCFSVWAGCTIAFLFFSDLSLVHKYVDWFIVGLLLHRLSNLFHNIMDRIHDIE